MDKDFRFPLPDEIFEFDAFEREYFEDWLWFPHQMIDWVPIDIQHKFGTPACGMVSGDHLIFDFARETEIVREFEKHGYTCIRDNHLVAKAAGF